MAGCSSKGIGDGRSATVRITFEIPVNQEGLEFTTMGLTQLLAGIIDDHFNEKLDYSVYIED